MINKYQEALNEIKTYINIYDHQMKQEEIDILQELINQTEMLVDATNQLEKENDKLEKALDKACDRLSELTKDANIPELNVHSVVYSKEAWKEWLLKDE